MSDGQSIKKGDIFKIGKVLYRARFPPAGGPPGRGFVPAETIVDGKIQNSRVEETSIEKVVEGEEASSFAVNLEDIKAGVPPAGKHPDDYSAGAKRRRTRYRKSRKNKRTRRR